MLLNNFKAILSMGLYSWNPKVTNFKGDSSGLSSGYTSLSYVYASSTSGNNTYPGISRFGIVVGTGTIPPQLTDYKLENRLISGYTSSNGTISYTNNKLILSEIITATSDITINEVGVRSTYRTSSATTSDSDMSSALLTRTVLSEPVVLTAGQSKTFTVEIDFNTFVDNVNNL